MAESNEKWRAETNSNRKKLKDYFNVEFPPLIPTNTKSPNDTESPTVTLVHTKLPIALLHTILLNPCNHLIQHLSGVWPGLEGWLQGLHVVRDNYHGEKFEGKETAARRCRNHRYVATRWPDYSHFSTILTITGHY